MKFLHELVDYIHHDKTHDTRSYIMSTIAKQPDTNKGLFWEKVLEKAMKNHTRLLEHNARYRDFEDNTDAKFATYYRKVDGKLEASVSGIRNKIGPLRICLCVPGENYHKVHFLFVPYKAYQPFKDGSNALKFGLNPRGRPTGSLAKYICSFESVIRPNYVDI